MTNSTLILKITWSHTLTNELIKTARTNNEIRSPRINLIIGENPPEVLSIEDARRIAEEQEMDLVEVNPNSNPPLCKLMDYGKFLYKKKKQEQNAKKNQKQVEVKTLRFGFRISEHDLEIKNQQARKFLEKGNLIKIHSAGKGRELAYVELAKKKVEKFIANLADIATVEQQPKVTGGNIHCIIKPTKK